MSKLKPVLRNDHYYLRKRVPGRYHSIETRRIINICLFADSLSLAKTKAETVWREIVEAWETKLAGLDTEGEARLSAARELAHRRGMHYLAAPQVAQLPIRELMDRILKVQTPQGKIDLQEADAVLGLPSKPDLLISEAIDTYYTLADDKLRGKNKDQLRRHKNPRKKATRNFIEAVGDIPLRQVSTKEMFAFKKWWQPKIRDGEVQPSSANKDFNYLCAMWRAVAQAEGFQFDVNTQGLAFQDVLGLEAVRPPFSDDWIKTKLLADGALKGMNADARLILLGMINTGYRPSEGAGLLASEIVLDSNIPHIIIQPNENRALKNKQSRRTIPLLGVSLEAFRQAKSGFPRYASNSASLSGAVNKFLEENKLLETPKHTLYGLRHSLEDRMLRAGIEERVRMDVLGHQIKRERYGDGGGLEFVHEQLKLVAL